MKNFIPNLGRNFDSVPGHYPYTCITLIRWKIPLRSLPYHIGDKSEGLGTKALFRFLNAWRSHHKFCNFVKEKWKSYIVEERSSFILKKKFKLLKVDLKNWNKTVFDNLDKKIEKQIYEIRESDTIDEVFGLDNFKIMRCNELRAHMFGDFKLLASILKQKS